MVRITAIGALLGGLAAITVSVAAALGLFSNPTSNEPAVSEPSSAPQDVASGVATVQPENTCGTLQVQRVPVFVRDAGQAPQRFEQATSAHNCKVTVEVTLAAEPEDPNAVCVIVLEPVTPGPGEENGVVFNVAVEGPASCRHLEIASEVLLAPKQSARPSGGGGRSVPASVNFNPWAYSQVKAKSIGADCCTVDMFWNEIHMGWWWDGYYAGWGSWAEDDGFDPWWDFDHNRVWVTIFNFSNYQNHNLVYHNQPFHSDGFPLGLLADVLSPDVGASTETRITGYYNGYAVCSFPVRSYDYTFLAWVLYGNPLTHLKWKTNVCAWEVQG